MGLVLLILALVVLVVKRRGVQADVERKLSGEDAKPSSSIRNPEHLPSSSSTSLHTVPCAVARSLKNIRREQDGRTSEASPARGNFNHGQESEKFRNNSTALPRAIAVDVRGVTRLA